MRYAITRVGTYLYNISNIVGIHLFADRISRDGSRKRFPAGAFGQPFVGEENAPETRVQRAVRRPPGVRGVLRRTLLPAAAAAATTTPAHGHVPGLRTAAVHSQLPLVRTTAAAQPQLPLVRTAVRPQLQRVQRAVTANRRLQTRPAAAAVATSRMSAQRQPQPARRLLQLRGSRRTRFRQLRQLRRRQHHGQQRQLRRRQQRRRAQQ